MKIQFSKLLILAVCAAGITQISLAQEDGEQAHVAVKNPAKLTQDEANKVYDGLKELLEDRYSLSGLKIVENYQSWKRYNTAPYISATHGQRFVNSYANDVGKDYGALPAGKSYPKGTVFAKDSITVTDEGKQFPGAFFIMEKLEAGASPTTADWRYVMVIPDGTIFGDTTGAEPELTEYCHTCHEAEADADYVFFVPEEFRLPE